MPGRRRTGGDGGTGTQGQAQRQPDGIDTGDERYANCKTGADANDERRLRAQGGRDLARAATGPRRCPSRATPSSRPAAINTFAGAVDTGCGQATSAGRARSTAPRDQQIYLDTTFFADVLEGQLGGQGGDFVEPYVLGHEYGHHIQNLLGTMGRVKTQQGADSRRRTPRAAGRLLRRDVDQGTPSDRDGGVTSSSLDQADITEALDAAKAVGDDRIQKKSGQSVDPEGWTHGSSEERQRWFMHRLRATAPSGLRHLLGQHGSELGLSQASSASIWATWRCMARMYGATPGWRNFPASAPSPSATRASAQSAA